MKIIIDDIEELKRKFDEQNKEKLSIYKKNKGLFYLLICLGIVTFISAKYLINEYICLIMFILCPFFFSAAMIFRTSFKNPSKCIREKEKEMDVFCKFLYLLRNGHIVVYDYDYNSDNLDEIVFFYYDKCDNSKTLHRINCPVVLEEKDADGYDYSIKETTFDFNNLVCIYGNEEIYFIDSFINNNAEELYKMLVYNGFWEGTIEPQIVDMKKVLTVEEREKLTNLLITLQKNMQKIFFENK